MCCLQTSIFFNSTYQFFVILPALCLNDFSRKNSKYKKFSLFLNENFFEKRCQNLNESPPNLSYPTGTDLSFPGLLSYFFSLFFILLTYNSFERLIVISPCADIYYDFCFHCEIKLGKRHISSYISYQQII